MLSTSFGESRHHRLFPSPACHRQWMGINPRFPADNYNHLFEQPTLFYAVAIVLALT